MTGPLFGTRFFVPGVASCLGTRKQYGVCVLHIARHGSRCVLPGEPEDDDSKGQVGRCVVATRLVCTGRLSRRCGCIFADTGMASDARVNRNFELGVHYWYWSKGEVILVPRRADGYGSMI
jgi:hypothetical protein